MTTHSRKHTVDLIAESTRREDQCLQGVSALLAQIAARQQAGSLARATRAVFSTLRLADSHQQALGKLDDRLAQMRARLADIRAERRHLEAGVAAEELLPESARARPSQPEMNSWAARVQSFTTAHLGEARALARNIWADRNKDKGAHHGL